MSENNFSLLFAFKQIHNPLFILPLINLEKGDSYYYHNIFTGNDFGSILKRELMPRLHHKYLHNMHVK